MLFFVYAFYNVRVRFEKKRASKAADEEGRRSENPIRDQKKRKETRPN